MRDARALRQARRPRQGVSRRTAAGARFWPALAAGFAAEASAVALLAVSAWLIVRASEQPPCSISRRPSSACASSHCRARPSLPRAPRRPRRHLRQLATTRARWSAASCRSPPTASPGRDADLCSAPSSTTSTICRPSVARRSALVSSATVALGAVVFIAIVWWPAALTLLACLVVAGLVATFWGWAAGARAERGIARCAGAGGCRPRPSRQPRSAQRLTASRSRVAAHPRRRRRLRRAITRRSGAQAGTAALVSLLAGAARSPRSWPVRRPRHPALSKARCSRWSSSFRWRCSRCSRRCRSPLGVAPGALVGAAHRGFGSRRAPAGLAPESVPATGAAPPLGTGSACAARRCAGRGRRKPRSATSISTSAPANACSSSARAERESRRSRTRWSASSRRTGGTRSADGRCTTSRPTTCG